MWIQAQQHIVASFIDCQCPFLVMSFIILVGTLAVLAMVMLLLIDVISCYHPLCKIFQPFLFSLKFLSWGWHSKCFFFLVWWRSGRIYAIDTKADPRAPSLYKYVDPKEIAEKTGLAFPHTTHCLASGEILVSCLGDKDGNAQGSGFLLLDSDFNIKNR